MRIRSAVLVLATLTVACVHHNPNEQPEPRAEPITVHVKNENYLDVNVAAVVSGISHRLGTVSGNGSGDFHIAYNLVQSESFVLVVTPIGGSDRFVSAPLSVSEGQVVELRAGSFLRQSSVVIHEP